MKTLGTCVNASIRCINKSSVVSHPQFNHNVDNCQMDQEALQRTNLIESLTKQLFPPQINHSKAYLPQMNKSTTKLPQTKGQMIQYKTQSRLFKMLEGSYNAKYSRKTISKEQQQEEMLKLGLWRGKTGHHFDEDVDDLASSGTMSLKLINARPSYDSNTLFEVQDHDTFVDHMDEYHEVHEMQSDVNTQLRLLYNDRKNAETSVPKPLSALTVYPSNTPVKLVPRVLPLKINKLIVENENLIANVCRINYWLMWKKSRCLDLEAYNANDVTDLLEQNERLRAKIEKIEDLKAQLEGNLKVVARSSVKTKVLAPAGPTIEDTSITQADLHPPVNPVVGEPSSAQSTSRDVSLAEPNQCNRVLERQKKLRNQIFRALTASADVPSSVTETTDTTSTLPPPPPPLQKPTGHRDIWEKDSFKLEMEMEIPVHSMSVNNSENAQTRPTLVMKL
ncbi:hypothetical protein Tco_0795538 [Tanacetum coccineum]